APDGAGGARAPHQERRDPRRGPARTRRPRRADRLPHRWPRIARDPDRQGPPPPPPRGARAHAGDREALRRPPLATRARGPHDRAGARRDDGVVKGGPMSLPKISGGARWTSSSSRSARRTPTRCSTEAATAITARCRPRGSRRRPTSPSSAPRTEQPKAAKSVRVPPGEGHVLDEAAFCLERPRAVVRELPRRAREAAQDDRVPARLVLSDAPHERRRRAHQAPGAFLPLELGVAAGQLDLNVLRADAR